MNIEQTIIKKQCRLYYILNKDVVNKNRKKYKRQTWNERKDNPRNKGIKK